MRARRCFRNDVKTRMHARDVDVARREREQRGEAECNEAGRIRYAQFSEIDDEEEGRNSGRCDGANMDKEGGAR